jgi:hypothetical protein
MLGPCLLGWAANRALGLNGPAHLSPADVLVRWTRAGPAHLTTLYIYDL